MTGDQLRSSEHIDFVAVLTRPGRFSIAQTILTLYSFVFSTFNDLKVERIISRIASSTIVDLIRTMQSPFSARQYILGWSEKASFNQQMIKNISKS
jgi:hypothetical protein